MSRFAAAVLALALSAVAAAAEPVVPASVFANPLALQLSLSTHLAATGEAVRARVTAANGGSATLSNLALALRSDPAGISVAGAATRVVATIRGDGTARVTWTICGVEPGRYLILARGSFVTSGGAPVTSESASELLEVAPSRRTRCPS